MYYEKSNMLKAVSSMTFKKVIGEIISCYCDDDTGNMLYTVSLGGAGFPLLLNEDYLSKLDMVVSQG